MIDERSRNEVCPKLLDLISNEREWKMNKSEEKCSEEKKLELRLGPPSGEDWCEDKMKNINNNRYFSNNAFQKHNLSSSSTSYHHQHQHQGNNKASSFVVMGNDASQAKVLELQNGAAEKKVLSSPSSANTAVPNNTSQKRNAPGPLVGWPPIRSFRKNLASSSTCKPPAELSSEQEQKHENGVGMKGLFVKINMDGVPIGRKVDLNAYNSYQNLSSSVHDLFRGLLAGQRESCGSGVKNKKGEEKEKGMMGLMDGSGEYTLVYEDNEGDRMLVGDVPWHMFLSTVKRVRVLKSAELSAFTFGSKKEKIPT